MPRSHKPQDDTGPEPADREASSFSAEEDKTGPRYHLAVLEQDLVEEPNCILPVSASKIARGVELTRKVVVTDDDEIPDTISL